MPGKHPKEYSIDEVCLWVFALGLGDKADAFREAAIDGDMLLSLGDEDFKELGLSSLQSKKVMRGIVISVSQVEQGGAGDESERIKELEAEIVELRAQLEENNNLAAPPPATAPAPSHDAPPVRAAPLQSNEHHVLRGAARGALGGVILGAVAGAVAGDAKKGAKIGAATGGAVGGMRGVGHRRRARMAGRRF
jgi:predicted lipid-binding transport protein (Tim44 family)